MENKRVKDIDLFLKNAYNSFSDDKKLDYNKIYYSLMVYNIPDKYLDDKYDDFYFFCLFLDWIEYFKQKKDITVEKNYLQAHFLQFYNNGDNKEGNLIKMYVPFEVSNMASCVEKLFAFIEKNGFVHYSKVASKYRTDGVVLRFEEKEDALKVLDYINNTPDLKNNLINTNPFVFNQDGVGFACDRLLSYNSVISTIIYDYIIYCKENNKSKDVGIDDFREFISKYKKDIFYNSSKLESFMNKSEVEQNLYKSRVNVVSVLNNYKQIFDLLELVLSPETKLNDILNHVDKCNNEELAQGEMSTIKRTVDSLSTLTDLDVDNLNKCTHLLDSYIKYNVNDSTLSYTIGCLNRYLMGVDCVISNDNDFRNEFKKCNMRRYLKYITNNDIEGYIDKLLYKDKSKIR